MLTPLYTIQNESGKDHQKVFTIEATVQWVTIGVGVGANKKKAQEFAAQNALQNQEEWQYLLNSEEKLK
jgi:dsRNA-specific ribonuclease